MYRPYEEVIWQCIKDTYKDHFKKDLSARSIITYERYMLKEYPDQSPSKTFFNKIKIIGEQ